MLERKKKVTVTTTKIGPEIKDVVFVEGPIYSDGPFDVWVGYINTKDGNDIPHYLIVNKTYSVVEGSAANLTHARNMASELASILVKQDQKMNQGKLDLEDDNDKSRFN